MSYHFFFTVVEFSGSLTNHIAVLIRLVRSHDFDFGIMSFVLWIGPYSVGDFFPSFSAIHKN